MDQLNGESNKAAHEFIPILQVQMEQVFECHMKGMLMYPSSHRL